MDFNNVINVMSQQLRAIKAIEDLIAHNKQQNASHSVKQEDIEVLKAYVENMKLAANTATALAEYYKNAEKPQPAETTTEKPADTAPELAPVTEESQPSEKPKRKRSSAKKQDEQKEEPAVEPSAEEADNECEFDFLL